MTIIDAPWWRSPARRRYFSDVAELELMAGSEFGCWYNLMRAYFPMEMCIPPL